MSDLSHDRPYVFTTMRWQPDLLDSARILQTQPSGPSPFYLLAYHVERMQHARKEFLHEREPFDGNEDAHGLLRPLVQFVDQWQRTNWPTRHEAARIRAKLHADGQFEFDALAVHSLSLDVLCPTTLHAQSTDGLPEWKVVLDRAPTTPSVATTHKTSSRSDYDGARERASISSFSEPKEVLLFNQIGQIMDGSITTPYFLRAGQWITPAACSGGQLGTTRQWALHHHLCVECGVGKASLRPGEVVWLSNAVRGFFQAVVDIDV